MQRDLGQLNSSSVWRAAQTFDLLAGLVWSVCAAPYGTNHIQIHHQHSFSKLIEYAWHHQSCERGQAGSVGFLNAVLVWFFLRKKRRIAQCRKAIIDLYEFPQFRDALSLLAASTTAVCRWTAKWTREVAAWKHMYPLPKNHERRIRETWMLKRIGMKTYCFEYLVGKLQQSHWLMRRTGKSVAGYALQRTDMWKVPQMLLAWLFWCRNNSFYHAVEDWSGIPEGTLKSQGKRGLGVLRSVTMAMYELLVDGHNHTERPSGEICFPESCEELLETMRDFYA